jgi:flavin-dependent dehydrogenase
VGGGIPASLADYVSGFESPNTFSDLSVTHLRHSWKGKDHVHAEMTMSSGEPAQVWMVQRPHFDAWLVDRAAKCGATVRSGVKVNEVYSDGGMVTVSTADGEVFTAKHVVGADGAKGIVGARVGLRLGKRWGIAREAEIPFEGGSEGNCVHPDLLPRTAYLDYGSVPNGIRLDLPQARILVRRGRDVATEETGSERGKQRRARSCAARSTRCSIRSE